MQAYSRSRVNLKAIELLYVQLIPMKLEAVVNCEEERPLTNAWNNRTSWAPYSMGKDKMTLQLFQGLLHLEMHSEDRNGPHRAFRVS